VPPTDDPKRESADTMHAAENTPSVSPPKSTPTFPAEAESLLHHLKLGAARADTSAAPPPGAFPVVPNYEIEGEIGRGGMGVVYKARHAALRHTVAVKMILASAHAAPVEVARFLAEAEAIAAVKHPNVVQVYDLSPAGERPYFVMEYVEGGSLARLLKSDRLAPRTAAELLEPVARGVQAAHDAGIVHRDLKPANILLGVESQKVESRKVEEGVSGRSDVTTLRLDDVTPKVSDFGLAKRLSSDLTRSQAVMGTPQYMAPEQACGKAKFVGPGADVYALGVILYECLVGTVPFQCEDDNPWSLIRQVLEDPPEPPRKHVPGVPRDLELICLKCLEKEPHHRYPTAAALADDLKRFLNNEPVSVRPIGPVTRATRWAKRRPAAAGLVALAVLLALIVPPVLVWVEWSLDRREKDANQAREREETAIKLALAAKRAEEEANRAKHSAERLAETQELFGIRNQLRNRATARPLGWTAATRAELPKAVALAAGDQQVLGELRSVAAVALLAPDLFPLEPCANVTTGSALATDPKTGRIAVGEFKSWGDCRVLLLDKTGRPERTLKYTTVLRFSGQDGTRALAFGPGGTRLYVGTRESRVIRFDLDKPDKKPAKMWVASNEAVEQLAVSADGKIVYGLCRPEAPVFAWDAETGERIASFTPDGGVIHSFALLPSGELIACTGAHLYRWRADGTRVSVTAGVPGHRLAVNGSMLLVGDGPRLAIHSLDTGELTDPLTDPGLRLTAHDEYLKSIAVHPCGAFVATAAGDSTRAVKVWELASARLIGTVFAPGTDPIALVWSADGTTLLATAAGHVERWKFAPGQAREFACASGFPLASAALARAGQVAVVSEHAKGWCEVLVGAPGTTAEVARLRDEGGNGRPGVAVAANRTLAVTLHRPGIFAWKPGAPLPAPAFTNNIGWCPRFAPDGALWAIVDSREIRAFEPSTKRQRAEWRNDLGEVLHGLASLDALAVGRTLAVAGGRDGTVFLLDPATCKPTTTFRSAGDPVLSVALAPDESFVVAGTQNGNLRLVQPATKTELPAVPAHPGGVTAVSVNRDGTLLATGGRDRAVRLWKRAGDRFEPLFTVAYQSGLVRELQFCPADNRLLVLLVHEHAVRVWDVDRLKGHLAELNLGW
jgi:serine/threonine protein kinase/WD40 repeat protein